MEHCQILTSPTSGILQIGVPVGSDRLVCTGYPGLSLNWCPGPIPLQASELGFGVVVCLSRMI